MYRFDHFNFNIFDLEKSLTFYKYENPAMGTCFISDLDGYWIEIVPER